jgi:antitoxin VapB
MAFHVRDSEKDLLVRTLARKRGIGLTDAIKLAVGNELKRTDAETPFMETVRQFQEEVASWGETGLKADKAFFDDMSGEAD